MSDIQKVAKEAGVSVATVSRVLNKHPSVSIKTRRKVEEVINRMNYQPNMLGRNLRSSKSQLLLMLVPNMSNPFYAQIILGAEQVALANNYNIMLCTTNSKIDRELMFFDMVKRKLVDGVISLDPSLEFYQILKSETTYPVILCGEFGGNESVPYVSIDNVAAAKRAVNHLISLGHRKIAMINSNIFSAKLREDGYLQALQEHGIPCRPEWMVYNDDLGFESARTKTRELITMEDRPTAIFAVSDTIAIAALKTIRDYGLRSPEDVAVIGFDNIEFSAMMNPTLTTIAQPTKEIGNSLAEMLLQKISNPLGEVGSRVLNHELIIRESTISAN